MAEETTIDLLRRYLVQQGEFGYPDPILTKLELRDAETLPVLDGDPGPVPAAAAERTASSEIESEEEATTLGELRAAVGDCALCALSAGRNHLVFGVGDPDADLLFIGEGPGADEDRLGEPFVGRAGQLLDRILDAAGITRNEVYITNVVKCRPPGNRDPEADEIVSCLPFLRRQIEIIDPKIICALGRFASQTLLGRPESIGRLRGVWHEYEGRKLICTYHPSACLRNATYKRPVWEDFQALRDEYRKIRPA
ncbi:MAG: uracil-DNA glycosylase [Candidatus Eisenbacteria bacterium]